MRGVIGNSVGTGVATLSPSGLRHGEAVFKRHDTSPYHAFDPGLSVGVRGKNCRHRQRARR